MRDFNASLGKCVRLGLIDLKDLDIERSELDILQLLATEANTLIMTPRIEEAEEEAAEEEGEEIILNSDPDEEEEIDDDESE